MRLMKRHRSAAAACWRAPSSPRRAMPVRNSAKQEDPIPATPKQDLTAIQRTFAPPTPPPLTVFPELREQWKDTPAFLRDSKFDINFRSYYRDEVTNAPNSVGIKEAWAGGGSVSAETGRLFDVVSLRRRALHVLPDLCPARPRRHRPAAAQPAGLCRVRAALRPRAPVRDALRHGRPLPLRHAVPGAARQPHDRPTPSSATRSREHSAMPRSGGPTFNYGGGWIGAIKPRDAIDFQSMASKAGVPTSNCWRGRAGRHV